ncbi:MAG: hypothetical protein H7315_02120 [Herminiimonas sp.]|nr:hypothetical protein [Herminiimonas sp.]
MTATADGRSFVTRTTVVAMPYLKYHVVDLKLFKRLFVHERRRPLTLYRVLAASNSERRGDPGAAELLSQTDAS